MTIITGSNKRPVQKRATRRDGWTRTKRARFLDELSATCNVRRSAAAVAITEGSARALRRRDPVFARLWQEALQAGYDRLEMELVERALGVVADDDDNPTEADRTELEQQISVADAIRILQVRNAAMAGRVPRGKRAVVATEAEVDAALLAALTAVEKRLKAAG